MTPPADDANTVRLRGRLAAAPEERVLPSGDEITTWRVVVQRAKKDIRPVPDGGRSVGVDALECSTWRPGIRRQVSGWQPDDVVEVDGALQRRFYRHEGRLMSRHEVVARSVRRVSRAPATTKKAPEP